MSSTSEPYARPLGILVGLGILWFGTLLIVFAVRTLFFKGADPAAANPEAETGLDLRRDAQESSSLVADRAVRAVLSARAVRNARAL